MYISEEFSNLKTDLESKAPYETACYLADLGFSITPPLVPGSKGTTYWGWKDCQTERASVDEVRRWAYQNTGKNYGIVTGAISGIVVLEADNPEAERLVQERCPDTPLKQRSASGRSLHRVYRHPGYHVQCIGGIEYRGTKYRLDLKADGGLIVGPNSRFEADGLLHYGVSRYQMTELWTRELLEACPVFDPGWLEIVPKPKPVPQQLSRTSVALTDKQQQAQRYLAGCPGTQAGNSAGGHCFWLACTLTHGFDLTPEEAIGIFMEWGSREDNLDADGSYYPWEERELMHKLQDAEGKEHEGKRGERLHKDTAKLTAEVQRMYAERSKVTITEITDQADEEKVELRFRRKGYRLRDLERLPVPKWLVKNHIATQSLGCIFGPSGEGKTFYALNMALAVAHGSPFLGLYPTLKTPVMYLSAEGNSTIQYRLKAWMQMNKQPYPEDMVIVPFQFDLCDSGEIADIMTIIEKDLRKKPGLIFVDTVARYFGGNDENKTQDMNRFVNVLDKLRVKTDSTVMVNHHTGWAELKRERGSNALRGACDTIINIKKDPDFQVSCCKQKEADPFKTYSLRANVLTVGEDDDGSPITSLAFAHLVGPEQKLALLSGAKRDSLVTLWQAFQGATFTQRQAEQALNKSQSAVSKDLMALKTCLYRKVVEYDEGKNIGYSYHIPSEITAVLEMEYRWNKPDHIPS
jgi:AAA domain/Bifunctional DNA primase/polymerase, N-terminal